VDSSGLPWPRRTHHRLDNLPGRFPLVVPRRKVPRLECDLDAMVLSSLCEPAHVLDGGLASPHGVVLVVHPDLVRVSAGCVGGTSHDDIDGIRVRQLPALDSSIFIIRWLAGSLVLLALLGRSLT
jgi:hypothetical protein